MSWNSGRTWVEVATQHWSFLILTQQHPSGVSLYSAGTAPCVGRPRLPVLSEPPASVGRAYLKHLCFRLRKKKAVKAISCWPAVPRSSWECENIRLFLGSTFKRASASVVLLLLEIPGIPLPQHFTNWELRLLRFSFPSYSLFSLYNHKLISLRASFILKNSPDVMWITDS